jgi:hypothetical protein
LRGHPSCPGRIHEVLSAARDRELRDDPPLGWAGSRFCKGRGVVNGCREFDIDHLARRIQRWGPVVTCNQEPGMTRVMDPESPYQPKTCEFLESGWYWT